MPADIQIGMNRGLYTAASATSSSQVWLDTVANNLANASTTGYRRDEVDFEESLLRELKADGGKGQIIGDMQSDPEVVNIITSFQHGSIMATGDGLDVAIQGNAGMSPSRCTSATFARPSSATASPGCCERPAIP